MSSLDIPVFDGGLTARLHYAAFDDEHDLLAAAREGRDRGLELVEAYSPHPLEGFDALAGRGRSRLPAVTLVAGLTGLGVALWFQYWTSATDWPLNVGGKPFDSLPAFVPVAFELMVLFAGLATAAALFVRSRLGPGARVTGVHPRVSDDRYVLVVRPTTADLDAEALAGFWAAHHARESWTSFGAPREEAGA